LNYLIRTKIKTHSYLINFRIH